MKKQKFLCIEFHNENGDTVPELCKCPANPADVNAALAFLKLGCDLVVSIQDCELSDDGVLTTPFGQINTNE